MPEPNPFKEILSNVCRTKRVTGRFELKRGSELVAECTFDLKTIRYDSSMPTSVDSFSIKGEANGYYIDDRYDSPIPITEAMMMSLWFAMITTVT